METQKTPLLTVDTVILCPDNSIILIKRKYGPYKGHWAIPGGFVELGESVEQAAIREAKEETGLDIELISLIGVYSNPDRDPRGHVATVAYTARPISGELKADSDAKDAFKFDENQIKQLKLAFDHETILKDALNSRK